MEETINYYHHYHRPPHDQILSTPTSGLFMLGVIVSEITLLQLLLRNAVAVEKSDFVPHTVRVVVLNRPL